MSKVDELLKAEQTKVQNLEKDLKLAEQKIQELTPVNRQEHKLKLKIKRNILLVTI